MTLGRRAAAFGLGAATQADLHRRWLNGALQQLSNVKSGQILTVREPTLTS